MRRKTSGEIKLVPQVLALAVEESRPGADCKKELLQWGQGNGEFCVFPSCCNKDMVKQKFLVDIGKPTLRARPECSLWESLEFRQNCKDNA